MPVWFFECALLGQASLSAAINLSFSASTYNYFLVTIESFPQTLLLRLPSNFEEFLSPKSLKVRSRVLASIGVQRFRLVQINSNYFDKTLPTLSTTSN